MLHKIKAAAVSAAAGLALLLSVAGVAVAATPTPAPTPPSVVQICAATSVAQVDALLDAVASSQLVGALAPLATITVPDGQGVKLSVDLDKVREQLNCGPTTSATPTATPTATATSTPTSTPAPTTTKAPADDDDDFDQVGRVPSGAAETGDGSRAVR